MKRENSIVGFNDNISHLGRMYKRIRTQNTVSIFFAYLEIQMGTKYRADTVVKEKSRLKILKAIYIFSFYTDNNNNRFNELITFITVTVCLTVISKKNWALTKLWNQKGWPYGLQWMICIITELRPIKMDFKRGQIDPKLNAFLYLSFNIGNIFIFNIFAISILINFD